MAARIPDLAARARFSSPWEHQLAGKPNKLGYCTHACDERPKPRLGLAAFIKSATVGGECESSGVAPDSSSVYKAYRNWPFKQTDLNWCLWGCATTTILWVEGRVNCWNWDFSKEIMGITSDNPTLSQNLARSKCPETFLVKGKMMILVGEKKKMKEA